MRDFLNGILTFIGAASLSDEEFGALSILSADYNQETYNALAAVLVSRGALSTVIDRLAALFKAKGLDVAPAVTGKTNILLGAVLC